MTRYSDDGREWQYSPLGIAVEQSMVDEIDQMAKAAGGCSRSAMIRLLLSEAIAARKQAKETKP